MLKERNLVNISFDFPSKQNSPFDYRNTSNADSYRSFFGDNEPDHPDFRAIDDTELMGDFYDSLRLDRHPENWFLGTSGWLTHIMSVSDSLEELNALGSRQKELSTPEAINKAEDLSARIFKHWEHLNQIVLHFELVIRKR